MASITSCAGYIPPFRIATEVIRERWGGGSKGVETKAVGAADDDAVTLAIEAGRRALDGRTDVGTLIFATTTHPYQYGEVGPLVAEQLDLSADTYTQTVTGSGRAGTAGVRSALSQVAATGEAALVVASERPKPEPDTAQEMTAGAGAGAVLIEPGDDEGLVSVATESHSKPLLEAWQAPGGPRRDADNRFGRDTGYVDTLESAIRTALSAADWDRSDLDALIVSQPSPRFPGRVAGALGLDSDVVEHADVAANMGNLESTSPLVGLAGADIDAGDRIVIAGYGSGSADALAFEAASEPTAELDADNTTEISYLDYLEYTDYI
jgi:hydroxymethylglutaryl-CoA synthase